MLYLGKPGPVTAVGRIDGEGCPNTPRRSMEACRGSSRGSLELGRLGRSASSGVRMCSGAQTSREQVPQGRLLRRANSNGAQTAREYKKWRPGRGPGGFLKDGRANLNNAMGLPWCALDVATPVGTETSKGKAEEKGRGGTRSGEVVGKEEEKKAGVLGGERESEASSVSRLYNLNEEIGRGTYGIVYSGSEVASGRRVAVKKIPSAKGSRSGGAGLNKAKQEADIMKAMQDCTSAVQFRGFFDKEKEKGDDASYIVMEHCSGGDLGGFVKKHGPVSELHAVFVAAEVLNLLKHCHDTRILHGDVKAGNFVIISEIHEQMFLHRPSLLRSGWLKGIDFGTCQYLGTGHLSNRVGTPTHWAPEVFGSCFLTQADMWSLGVMLYHLMSGRLPYCDEKMERSLKTEREMLRLVMTQSPDFSYGPWLDCSPQAKDFIKGLLTKDSRARMTVSEALQHPWIRMQLNRQSTHQSCFQGLTQDYDTWIPCFT